MNKTLIYLTVIIGILFIGFGVYYFMTPAGSLMTYVPGYETGVTTIHVKHGLGSIILGLALFAYAWFASGPRVVQPTVQ